MWHILEEKKVYKTNCLVVELLINVSSYRFSLFFFQLSQGNFLRDPSELRLLLKSLSIFILERVNLHPRAREEVQQAVSVEFTYQKPGEICCLSTFIGKAPKVMMSLNVTLPSVSPRLLIPLSLHFLAPPDAEPTLWRSPWDIVLVCFGFFGGALSKPAKINISHQRRHREPNTHSIASLTSHQESRRAVIG